LTHTSGLEPSLPLWRNYPDATARINAVLKTEQKQTKNRYCYSDLNFIVLGVLVQRCSGFPLDTLVADRITDPLGMIDTGFNPPRNKLHRIAATECQSDPARGLVHGEVHDENAYSLAGV